LGKEKLVAVDDEHKGCLGVYGQQPFYLLYYGKSKKFGEVFMLNSNILINKIGQEGITVTHKMIDGVFDLYFFYPGSAEFVVRKYHDLVGKPYLPPFWALGYHHARRGWNTLSAVRDVVAKFEQNDLPSDGVWSDYEYMGNYREFTVNPARYKDLDDYVKNYLHRRRMHGYL
jgi:alpha-glucosidase (family GH31 glycosyl hydrolase)